MKKANYYTLKVFGALALFGIFILASCNEDDPLPDAPISNFSFTVGSSNDKEVTFTSLSEGATTYMWNFGDNMGTSDQENPTYIFSDYGTFSVSLTVTNEGGENEFSKDVTLTNPQAIVNGAFDDESNWTTINHYEETNLNGSVTIANGVALFEETTNADWKHMGIFQEVTLSAGTYQFDMDVSYADINDVWGEVYLGPNMPVAGVDYGTDQGATQILMAYNAWDCATKTFDGKATETGCDGATTPGEVVVATGGTYYVVFRTGGGQYGANGIEIDNVSMLRVTPN